MNPVRSEREQDATPDWSEDPEIVAEFIWESREHLTRVEVGVMALERHPEREAIDTVIRDFHSLKGLAGFFDLVDAEEVAHETENVLELVRDQDLPMTPGVAEVVLAAAAFLKTRFEATLTGEDPGAATGDLWKAAMSPRKVPASGLFEKMSRLVRDLARRTGKQARLDVAGAETEIDCCVAKQLASPLLHLVRNAMDHGLEMPAERLASGKDPRGRIWLRASRSVSQIVIELGDDGRGLARDKILAKAHRMGLAQDRDLAALIFQPGLSTAAQVTTLSGRGVGLDVVRRSMDQLRGRIEIISTPGQGTTFFLRLPDA